VCFVCFAVVYEYTDRFLFLTHNTDSYAGVTAPCVCHYGPTEAELQLEEELSKVTA
jgi:hypothetical protein